MMPKSVKDTWTLPKTMVDSFQILRHRSPIEGPIPLHHEQGQEDGPLRLGVSVPPWSPSHIRAGKGSSSSHLI